ncbi:MAG: dihydrofolate reductase family protein [Thermomicrobiales bacterium]
MRRITAIENVTLDGVMQAPGRPDEDTRGGFAHGGWAGPYNDAVGMEEASRGMAASASSAMLFGRRTWEDFATVWNRPGEPFSDFFAGIDKYVVSSTLTEPLAWARSILLAGDGVEAIRALKATDGPDLTILGSGALVRSLHTAGLIDVFRLSIHPLTLGSGQTLFTPDDHLADMTLVRSVPTTTGVIIATYEVKRDG